MNITQPATYLVASRWRDWALIGLFGLFLLLPLLDLFFPIDPNSPPSENRMLARFPARPANVGAVKKFMAGWEAYFNDHFGCRRCLVVWHNKLKWSLFAEKNARNVLVGTGGWMFQSERRMVDHFSGALQFTEPELQAWQKLLERRRDWLAQRGIKYVFALAPDKHSVYPEYLPAWLKGHGGRTKADQFFAYLKAHSTVEVIDLRPVLLAAKKSAPVYLQTDTHWNKLGAFLACEEVVRVLGQDQLPGLTPVLLDAFTHTNRFESGGDLANMRGIRVNVAESNAVIFTPKPDRLPALKFSVPKGEHVMDEAVVLNSQGQGRAMVYTDSFGREWISFLGYQFGETDFFWQYHLDGPLIEQRQPVVVITEMLERFFNMPDERNLPSQDVLP